MNNELQIQKDNKALYALLFIGVIFVSFNLRPSITAVGPLIGVIRDDMGLANWSVALLTSLPLIAFAIMSPLAPRLGHRFTNEFALIIGLVVLILGIGIRSIKFLPLIFIGTLLIGLGIAVCNVLIPGVIKHHFPLKVGLMTSVYSTSMAILATISSGISVPIAEGLQLGWQVALLVWFIPAIIAVILWILIFNKLNGRKEREVTAYSSKKGSSNRIWKSSLAWKVALFMGLQSTIYYVTISWLPELLMDGGMKHSTAGYVLSYFQFLSVPFSFIIPMLAVRLKSQRVLVVIVNIFYIAGIVGLLITNNFFLILIAVTLVGASSSANFALALSFLSIRAKNARDAADLSGMAQSVGYILASFGPILIGYIYDVTQNWTVPLLTLVVIGMLIIYFGLHAGQNKYVLD